MTLPPHIATALDVAVPCLKEAVVEAAENSGIAADLFGLGGAEFADALEVENVIHKIRSCSATLMEWAFLEISLGSDARFRALLVPAGPSELPVTAAGRFLVENWAVNESLVADRMLLENVVITGEEGVVSSLGFCHDFVDAWIVAKAAFNGSPKPPKWLGVSTIHISPEARLTKTDIPVLKFTNLLLESISETKAKWRFLALYRIFEHGYLSEILQTIQRNFFGSPKETLDSCRISVESEVRQFDALCTSSGLEAYFERFLESFERSKSSFNRYACALDNSLNKDGQLNQLQGRAAAKGVLICYKIRCSIVHSGLSAPIFEAYPDAPLCVEDIIGDLESAALAFLGVSVS